MTDRKTKSKWQVVYENGLHYPENDRGTVDSNPMWVRETVDGFSSEEGAFDYISKIVILEKKKFVAARQN